MDQWRLWKILGVRESEGWRWREGESIMLRSCPRCVVLLGRRTFFLILGITRTKKEIGKKGHDPHDKANIWGLRGKDGSLTLWISRMRRKGMDGSWGDVNSHRIFEMCMWTWVYDRSGNGKWEMGNGKLRWRLGALMNEKIIMWKTWLE